MNGKAIGAVVGGLLGAGVIALEQGYRREQRMRPSSPVLLPIAVVSAAYIGWYVAPEGEPPLASLGRLHGHPLERLAR